MNFIELTNKAWGLPVVVNVDRIYTLTAIEDYWTQIYLGRSLDGERETIDVVEPYTEILRRLSRLSPHRGRWSDPKTGLKRVTKESRKCVL